MKHPFKLEEAVERWRERADHRSSLTPSELEELEDHLRGARRSGVGIGPGACVVTGVRDGKRGTG